MRPSAYRIHTSSPVERAFMTRKRFITSSDPEWQTNRLTDLSARDMSRFWTKVDRLTPEECWPWLRTKNSGGYGVFWALRRFWVATHIAWFLANDREHTGIICHSCDNPSCVNPSHLWEGTALDNALDREAKGRNHQGRKTHCKNGHEYSPENTYLYRGHRNCRVCVRAAVDAYQARRREVA